MKSLFLSLFASSMLAGGAFAQSVPISQLPTTSSPNAAAQIPASVGTYPSEITFKYTPPQIVSAGATAIIPSPPTPGHCAQFTTTGTIGDSGAGCAGGGLTVPVAIAYGGTGATTQAGAQTNLGLGTSNNVNFNSVYLGSGNATVTNSFTAPLTEVTAFTGSTTSATATLGAFLAQNDGTMGGLGGIIENLNIVSGEVGSRIASASNLNVTSKSANTSGVIYVGGSEYCDIHVSDGSSSGSGSPQNYSACSGSNTQALIEANVIAGGVAGEEIDTFVGTGATVYNKYGLLIVDALKSGDGKVRGTNTDVALSLNNQYQNGSNIGWKVGLDFGAPSAYFPVASNGTLVFGENVGSTWTVANGIDWHLGTASNYWVQLGSVYSIDGSGDIAFSGTLTGPAPTASKSFEILSGSVPFAQAYGNSGNYASTGYGTDTLVGLGAGASLPLADYLTTAIGWHALNASTSTNTESTAVGWHSQGSMTTGNQNTTLGVNTLGSCLTCVHDMNFGTDSLRNGTASYDVGIGVSTLINDFGSGDNVAIGDTDVSGNASFTGGLIVAIGFNTFNCTSCTSAQKDMMIGQYNAPNATTLNNSIGIGYEALQSATTGGQIIAIGSQSLQNLAGSNGLITAVGNNTGGAATNAQQSTLIGANVGNTTFGTSGSNPNGIILIGSGLVPVDVPNTSTNQYINIENVYIEGSNAPTAISGFGTSPTITASGTAAFKIQVGASGTPSTSTQIGLQTAPHGWICTAQDQSSNITARQSGNTYNTVTLIWSAAPSNNDQIFFQCGGY